MTNSNRKRVAAPTLALVSLATVGTLIAGCSSDSNSNGATAGDEGSSAQSQGGAAGSALAYSKCMREHGVTNYPDPQVDSRGAVQMGVPDGIDPNSPTFQSAQSACQSKLFQSEGDTAGARTFDATKVAPWAKCIRAHGMPNFPDPRVQGDTIVIDASAAGISGRDDPRFTKATQACYSIRPGGNLMIVQALK